MTQANLYFTGKAAGSLVKIHDDMMWTTSVLIADRFGKRHDNVLQAIKNLTCSDEFRHLKFSGG